MEIKKDVCVDVIKTNIKGINKKLFILEKLIYNTELTGDNEFLIDAVSESIDSVKDCLGGIETVVNYIETKDDEKDIEIEMLNKEIEKLKVKLNSVYGVKNNFRSTKYLAKERFIQLYEEHLNTGTAPYKLCKKYHLSPSTYYKYLKMYNEGGINAL